MIIISRWLFAFWDQWFDNSGSALVSDFFIWMARCAAQRQPFRLPGSAGNQRLWGQLYLLLLLISGRRGPREILHKHTHSYRGWRSHKQNWHGEPGPRDNIHALRGAQVNTGCALFCLLFGCRSWDRWFIALSFAVVASSQYGNYSSSAKKKRKGKGGHNVHLLYLQNTHLDYTLPRDTSAVYSSR